ncbi:glycosyltransferase family 39 protein [Roseomonas marmotae]|uniref:Glycosyltransferase family 39 protein n=1 Tax=Roseomonas marmotae TaxID=2768161 RepID=A0ABS3KCL9_9PROT|nr:glycosyltransferase family 39 protein [Roseomonas marmotae]QTI80784.1 glycosyltransferase family 39 protein [Roseomonas marmotae]
MRDALDRLPETRWPRLCLTLLCLLLWLPGFFNLPPGDRDESRFAQASRQMVESGDYVRIRYGEEARNKKPVGIHWAQSAVVHVAEALHLGDRTQIWPYRVPSLLGALLAVLATFHWGRALVGRRAAFLAAAMLASCMVLVVETHIAKTDAALLATVTAAMGLLGRAYLAPGAFTARQAAGFWLVLGASILLKGPIGPMVVLLATLTLAIADRGAPWLRRLRAGWGLGLMLLVVLPWFAAIGIATEGRFFAEAVGGDMLSKVGSGEEAHWGPPGYYLLTFLIAAFPAAFLVLRALPSAWRDRLNPGTRFLLAWIIPSWLVFEAVATKLPHYSLPMYPPLMLLGAAWAMDPLRRPAPRWLRGLGIFALVLGAGGLGIASGLLPWLADRRIDPLALLGIPAAALFLWVVLAEIRRGALARAGLAAAFLAIPIYAVALGGVLPRLTAPWVAPRMAALLAERAPGLPPAQFGVAGYHEPSQLFATGTGTVLLRNGAAAAAFLAEAPGRFAAVGDRDLAAFQAAARELGLVPQEEGMVEGYNYTRGRHIVLRLFRAGGGNATP